MGRKGKQQVIPRYQMPEMTEVFSDVARFQNWLEVELLVVEAWGELGVVPAEHAAAVRSRAPRIDKAFVEEVLLREEVTNHDVAAFVDVVQSKVGFPEGAWVHYGLTSSDVVDTAFAMMVCSGLDLVIAAAQKLCLVLRDQAVRFRDTVMVGRTHGIHAEPTTFGVKVALWSLQVERDIERLKRARSTMSVGKLSGAVGTYSNIDPKVEEMVLGRLGLRPVPATQVLARDRHAEAMYSLVSLASSIESFATEVRHLQRTEVGEAEEAFRKGQKGSSAMPHKRNPILSERLTGMARVMRGYLQPALEDIALWHERDISHSSVERIVFPDAFSLIYYMCRKATSLLGELVVYPEQMEKNLGASYGLVYSQPVLLGLIEAGYSRDDAYRMTQRNAMRAWQEGRSFKDLLDEDPEVKLSLDELDRLMDPERALKNIFRIFEALDGIEDRI